MVGMVSSQNASLATRRPSLPIGMAATGFVRFRIGSFELNPKVRRVDKRRQHDLAPIAATEAFTDVDRPWRRDGHAPRDPAAAVGQ